MPEHNYEGEDRLNRAKQAIRKIGAELEPGLDLGGEVLEYNIRSTDHQSDLSLLISDEDRIKVKQGTVKPGNKTRGGKRVISATERDGLTERLRRFIHETGALGSGDNLTQFEFDLRASDRDAILRDGSTLRQFVSRIARERGVRVTGVYND